MRHKMETLTSPYLAPASFKEKKASLAKVGLLSFIYLRNHKSAFQRVLQ